MSGNDERPEPKIKGLFDGVIPKDLVKARIWLEYRLRFLPNGDLPSFTLRSVIRPILDMVKAIERTVRETPIVIGDYWNERTR